MDAAPWSPVLSPGEQFALGESSGKEAEEFGGGVLFVVEPGAVVVAVGGEGEEVELEVAALFGDEPAPSVESADQVASASEGEVDAMQWVARVASQFGGDLPVVDARLWEGVAEEGGVGAFLVGSEADDRGARAAPGGGVEDLGADSR